MASVNGQTLGDALSSPLVLSAAAVGALAVLALVLVVMLWRRGLGPGAARHVWIAGGMVLAVLAVTQVLSFVERDASRRALLVRAAELSRAALAPGSALACLDAGAGETVETACEKAVFASAQSTAAAVAYMAARLDLLALAAHSGESGLPAALASTRRAIARDRFGVAAHVLTERDGCTVNACEAFALVENADALKANMRAQVFDQYVSRHEAAWNAPPPAAQPEPAVSSAPAAPQPAPVASAAPHGGTPPPAPIKPGQDWDYPSADSIPAVSIMGKEPPLPKGADASAQAGPDAGAPAGATAAPSAAQPEAGPPVPPRRPQAQAAPPAAR